MTDQHMSELFQLAFWAGVGLFAYAWVLFPLVMRGLARWTPRKPAGAVPQPPDTWPRLSVVIAALNEAGNLRRRVENIWASDYPSDRIEIVVVSDGSTDETADVVAGLQREDPGLVLLENEVTAGRAASHNRAHEQATGEILVFTDAETAFAPDFLSRICAAFRDPAVGFATGALAFQNGDEGVTAPSVGFYWRFEQLLRQWESDSGLNVFGSGACCAVRRGLFRAIPPTGDVDFTTPLDVVRAGHLCVHEPGAQAYDRAADTPGQEFRARVRMTAKNFRGTLGRWGIGGLLRHPVYSWVLLSHKYARWLTPLALAGVMVGTAGQAVVTGGLVWTGLLGAGGVLLGLAACHDCPRAPRIAGSLFSFLVANAAFAVGMFDAVRGAVPASYVGPGGSAAQPAGVSRRGGDSRAPLREGSAHREAVS